MLIIQAIQCGYERDRAAGRQRFDIKDRPNQRGGAGGISIYGTQRRVLEVSLAERAGTGAGTWVVGKKSCKEDSKTAK